MFEKRKEQESQKEDSIPKLQTTLSIFPDFEEKFPAKVEEMLMFDEESASDILLRIAADFTKLAQKLK